MSTKIGKIRASARTSAFHLNLAENQEILWVIANWGDVLNPSPNYLHESWRDYLYWDSELES